jgi:hypothetical protein
MNHCVDREDIENTYTLRSMNDIWDKRIKQPIICYKST